MDAAAIQAMQDQLLQQAQQIATLQAQGAAVQVQGQPPAPPVIPFALTPALAQQNVIDMSSRAGMKLHELITQPLEIKFNGLKDKLISFLDEVRQHTHNYGWSTVLLMVNNQHPTNPQVHDLLLHH